MKKVLAGIAGLALAAGAVGIAAAPASARQPAPGSTIVTKALELNASTGQFDTLLAAATCAQLNGAIVNALSVRGQRTLFAPTDGAFAALELTPSNVCSALTVEQLTDVLTYHVANGYRDAASVLGSTQIRMLNGDRVTVNAAARQLVDGEDRPANIVVTDQAAGNGVIHAIDSVLLPPGFLG